MSGLEAIAYRDGDTDLTGWLQRPAGPPRAAIMVFPTIANRTPAIDRRAAMLADAGFLVMIADYYGIEVQDFVHAGDLAKPLRADVDRYRVRLVAGISALADQAEAAGLAMGAVGYCMGGQAALEVARMGLDLKAVATFHGVLSTERPAAPGVIKGRVLICHGDADPMVPRAQALGFLDEMDAAGVNWHFHSYSGVKHGFTDPGSDERGIPAIAYDASADRQSWAALKGFLDEIFPQSDQPARN